MERLTKKTDSGYTTLTQHYYDLLDKLGAYEDKQEQGLIAHCTCGNCIHHDCADCSGDTIYCTELGVYRRINDSCNKAEAEEALARMEGE